MRRRGDTAIQRRNIAIASFALAAIALVGIVFAVRPVTIWHLGWLHIGNFTVTALPGKSASRTLSAQGIQTVEIDAQVGAVSLSTSAGQNIHMQWTVPANPAQAVTAVRQGNVLRIHFAAGSNVIVPGSEHLAIQLPEGLIVQAQLDAGALDVQGAYQSLDATLQAGALGITSYRGQLSVHANLGPINIQGAKIVGPLSLEDQAGPINFTGDPGLAATIKDQLGPINLNIAPSGTLQVTASVQLGPFSSGFPGLGGGTNGSFGGTIGSGPPGYLHISNQIGPVKLTPSAL